MKPLTQQHFKRLAPWVNTLAIDCNGCLWAYETNLADLECNRHRHWCPMAGREVQRIGRGYDIINWQQSAIGRA